MENNNLHRLIYVSKKKYINIIQTLLLITIYKVKKKT